MDIIFFTDYDLYWLNHYSDIIFYLNSLLTNWIKQPIYASSPLRSMLLHEFCHTRVGHQNQKARCPFPNHKTKHIIIKKGENHYSTSTPNQFRYQYKTLSGFPTTPFRPYPTKLQTNFVLSSNAIQRSLSFDLQRSRLPGLLCPIAVHYNTTTVNHGIFPLQQT